MRVKCLACTCGTYSRVLRVISVVNEVIIHKPHLKVGLLSRIHFKVCPSYSIAVVIRLFVSMVALLSFMVRQFVLHWNSVLMLNIAWVAFLSHMHYSNMTNTLTRAINNITSRNTITERKWLEIQTSKPITVCASKRELKDPILARPKKKKHYSHI